MTYREISVSHWQAWITYRACDHFVKLWTSIIIYIFFYMFLRHYPYSCFLSLFIFFRVCVWKQETRVHPSHQRRKPDKQRGAGREPSLHRYSQKRHKWRKTVNPWCTKSPKRERFFIVFCQQKEHFGLVNTHIVMSCYVNTVSQRVLLIKHKVVNFFL